MTNFDAAKEWVILLPPGVPGAKRAAGDLARYVGLLSGGGGRAPKTPALADASGPAPSGGVPVFVLNSEGGGPERNGFTWRAGPERVEIYGESGRGLCNGIYNFLAALGVSWPAPGKELLPREAVRNAEGFALTGGGAYEPSRYEGTSPAEAPWRRFVPSGKKTVRQILAKSEIFVEWAARRRYDALVFPLAAFASGITGKKLKELRKIAGEYAIGIEAGGRELSSLVPRKYFFFHRDFFRMEEGRRVRAHHFCPTNPGAIALMGREGARLFRAAKEVKVFHLWPDRGSETAWCSCPTCRAFTPAEQNRIGVIAAADILARLNPGAAITFFEKSGDEGGAAARRANGAAPAAPSPESPGERKTVLARKNLFGMERLPEEKNFPLSSAEPDLSGS